MAEQWLPTGWPRVIPRLFVDRPAECVAFIKDVFDAAGELEADRPSILDVGGSKIMVSGTEQRKAHSTCLYVYVPDVDAAYGRALSAGASTIEEPADMAYGSRRAMVRDPWGNDWQIATHISRA
jgi:PhnB protein